MGLIRYRGGGKAGDLSTQVVLRRVELAKYLVLAGAGLFFLARFCRAAKRTRIAADCVQWGLCLAHLWRDR